MKGVGVSFFISFVLIANLQNTESKRMSLDEIKIALLPVREVCIERVSVNPKMIDDANNGNFVPDRKLQCYYKCLLLMTKVMKNDQIIEKALHNIVQFMLNEDLASPVENAIKHCQPIMSKSIDGCELAYETVKCFYDSDSNAQKIRFYSSSFSRDDISLDSPAHLDNSGNNFGSTSQSNRRTPLQQSMHCILKNFQNRKKLFQMYPMYIN